jgi:hypothetical protein
MRLLVATEFAPDAAGGGAAIVRQMLEKFPSEIEVFWWSVLPSKNPKKCVTKNLVKKHFCGVPPHKLMPQRKCKRLKAWILEHFWVFFAAADFRKTIQQVRPDCVWAIPHNWSILPLHQVLVREKYPVRYHVSLHDYLNVHGFGGCFGHALESRLRQQQDDLYMHAGSRDAICQAMADDLEQLTGRPAGFICRKGVSLEAIPPLVHEEGKHGLSPIRLAYAGSVLVPEDFKKLMGALCKLQQFHALELHLYGAHDHSKSPWFAHWMHQHGNMNEDELKRELSGMDWGISLMAFGDHDPSYNRFSFPAKFSTYLGAGIPVITLGHPESSVVRMARSYNVGVVLENLNPASVNRLKDALLKPNSKESYRLEILRCVSEEFDIIKMSNELLSTLMNKNNTSDRID